MGLGINATLFSLTDQSGSQNLILIAKDPPGNDFIKKWDSFCGFFANPILRTTIFVGPTFHKHLAVFYTAFHNYVPNDGIAA